MLEAGPRRQRLFVGDNEFSADERHYATRSLRIQAMMPILRASSHWKEMRFGRFMQKAWRGRQEFG